jgi:hypothetical protein
LTRSRKEILRLLVEKAYLKTSDFYRLLAPFDAADVKAQASVERSTRRILRDFALRRYLRRGPLAEDDRDDSLRHYQHLYWLSRAGLRLARQHGLDHGGGKFNDEKSPNMLRHEDEISQFHIALEQGCARHSLELHWRRRNLKCTVNPDAVFGIADPQNANRTRTHYFFLEIEKSRQGNYRAGESGLIRKLKAYFRYRRTRACLRDWTWFDDFRVIIVVKNAERQTNLLKRLEELYPYAMFWITTEDAYKRDVMERIFKTPTGIERSFLDL